MCGCVRDTDIVARLGGDEFAIVQVAFKQPADATALARRLIEAMSAPYQLDERQVVVGTSIGIAIAPGDGTTRPACEERRSGALPLQGRWRKYLSVLRGGDGRAHAGAPCP